MGQRCFSGAGDFAHRPHKGASHVPLFRPGTFQSQRKTPRLPHPHRLVRPLVQTMANPPPGSGTELQGIRTA